MFKYLTLALCVSFLLILQSPAFGQKNFVKGNLFLSSGDTLSGFIDDQNWDHNPKSISFKDNTAGSIQQFNLNQLNGFNLEGGDVYKKAVVQVDKTPVTHQEIINHPKPIIVLDTVFLLEQVKGKVSLYHLLDEANKNHFFIQKKDGSLEELVLRLYVTYKNDQPLVGTAEQFKNQLKYSILTDYPALFSQIDKASYTKSSLSSLIEKYNNWLNPENPVQISKISKPLSKFGLIAGGNITNYKFHGQGYDYLLATSFKWENNPMIGLFYQLQLPRNRLKWSIYNELAWKRNNTQGHFNMQDVHYIYVQEAYYTGEGTVQIKTNYLGLTSLVRYSWMNQHYQPFLNFGLAGNLGLNVKTFVQGQEDYKAENTSTNREIFGNPSKYEVGVVAGGGLKINKVAAEIRLEKGTGYLNSNADVSVRKVMVALLLNYYFN
ncbi:outer membrane beta-barrel protein [Adhaeribacter pallidiroseus]|uniref:Outer membrane protein beta-barrel domain-containing protein n=1 Tax=Adhaeribacter pallidiroseus TaxID=2072847 RepID=A0A369QGB5_9BACT|nr:outer membrane beta-barrel protein [Adhaeribacter pallidiroseus]RDC62585.1 hypothetical protein AHMF7616_01179 [Adhaeribacter pallidiroseus]